MPDDPRNHISHFANISEYCNLLGLQVAHPLVAVIDRSEFKRNFQSKSAVSFGFYFVSLKEDKHCHFQYGRNKYDYQAGTLVFTAPGQIINMSGEKEYNPKGLALLFHPDLLIGSPLKYTLKIYSFFEYDVYEALHLSPEEKQLAHECFRNINKESIQAKDRYSQKLIIANLSLFLDYCLRFYDRQFSTRVKTNNSVIARFDQLLTDLLLPKVG
ncbi:hypothetical protein [Mucilaginibacter sp. SG564]|uniref:hypothetical protein n=1 Tax=Mucilaginibacter sp. SG564 TaxID=2587022 RepID=UPI001C12C438|nr:hypothetical protein [Mucilaginibacter sp. SG564]NOW96016.1 hypothetical protein [Mucilaginibacter sp. SG564]